MPGLSGEELRFALWFLLAGFVAGFAVSTVWEWLYFRRERWSLDGPNRFLTPQPTPEAVRAARGALLETESAIKPPLRATDSTGAPGFEVFEAPPRPVVGVRLPEPSPAPAPSVPAPPAPVLPASSKAASEPARAATKPARSRGLPDDLTRIEGVSVRDQQRLYAAQIFTWHQVATSDADVLAQITQTRDAGHVAPWIERARTLAVEHGRQNASYSGPLPEELTQIQGLTQRHARTLQRVGIVTFAQLAMASAAELSSLFDGAEDDENEGEPVAFPTKTDYGAWLRTARLLARAGGVEPVVPMLDAAEID